MHCYWEPELNQLLCYKTDDEYVEHFSSVFSEVVKSHLRAYGRVGSHLSGGLDSSIVVGFANKLIQQGRVPECGFEAFSVVYPDGWPCDERQHVDSFSKIMGIKTNFISPGIPGLSHYLEQIRKFSDFPDYPNGCGQWMPMNAAAIAKGFRVMLTGQGGNEWFEGSPLYLADLLSKLQFRKLYKEAKALKKLKKESSLLHLVFRTSFLPLLPPSVRRFGKKLLGKKDSIPSHISPAFGQQVDLRKRLRTPETSLTFSSLAQKDLYLRATNGWPVHAREMTERVAYWQGIEMRSPFYDRRLAEFALRLPIEQRYRDAVHRPMVRSAMRNLLPEHARHTDIQGDFSILFPKTFAMLDIAEPFKHLNIAHLGWIEPAETQQELRQIMHLFEQGDQSYSESMWQIWAVYGIELWHEQIFKQHQEITQARACAM